MNTLSIKKFGMVLDDLPTGGVRIMPPNGILRAGRLMHPCFNVFKFYHIMFKLLSSFPER